MNERDPRLRVSLSNDYAVLRAGNLTYYYGYEVTADEDGDEWCFEVKQDEHRIALFPRSQIAAAAGLCTWEAPERYLLAGIGLLLLSESE
jgi:hypothetical protein